MNKTTYVTTRFDVDDEFYVEVSPYRCDDKELFGFTLCNEYQGMKMFMFGMEAATCPEEEWEFIIARNIDSNIEIYFDELNALEGDYESERSISEAIEIHNNHVDALQNLGNALLEQYPNVEETPVNDAFAIAFGGVVGNAIHLCCDANSYYGEPVWMTTEDWHVTKG